MIIEHEGASPVIHPSAYVAPNAVVSGDVTVGPDCRILFGAVLTAEGGPMVIGERSVVMENAVLRSTSNDPLTIGDSCLIGPHAHVTGATLSDEVFVATGGVVFNGARLGRGTVVRISGVVHLRTVLPENSMVPIGWVAVGNPAEILSPDRHDEIWAIQKPLDFPGYVFGLDGKNEETMTAAITRRYSMSLGRHRDDEVSG